MGLFVNGVSYEAFESNREKTLAVVKLLEIIGEAVKKIPNERREQYPDIPWKSIAGMKDMLVIGEVLAWLRSLDLIEK
ncbi:MAG: DUF86 domain-containing protein [Stigonema ocellatum SAG 48.90 = DSM 106950]|nr:DUF86 domain-containing protein [Stigonema ocellatum SAG 48.90 = DSM 106950]